MLFQPPSIEQLSSVISQVTGPAFLLAAEAQLLSVLVSRLDRIVDRSQLLSSFENDDARAQLKAELPILQKRAKLIHASIYWGVSSCIVTSLLVIIGFLAAFLHFRHEYGSGFLFATAMTLFTVALAAFGKEVRLAYWEIDRSAVILQKRVEKSYPHA